MKTKIQELDEHIANCEQRLAHLESKVETTETGERCRQCEIESYKNFIASYQKQRQILASELFK